MSGSGFYLDLGFWARGFRSTTTGPGDFLLNMM